jgi:hypothetical protein
MLWQTPCNSIAAVTQNELPNCFHKFHSKDFASDMPVIFLHSHRFNFNELAAKCE